ncbi:MAG: isoprenylcysteine carboxylmethyltransferase family protein [bacterium]|nr:isoprenylcysteine carboxylmethyltransferase family protein [bacterium]
MLLSDKMAIQGNSWFRWRSYLPIILAPAAVLAAMDAGPFETMMGKSVENPWDLFALAVSFLGLIVRACVVGDTPRGTSGRNTRRQRADSLNTTGMYSITRNPLYFGNFLILLGFALAIKIWWFVLLTLILFALYYERIIFAEEIFLSKKFGAAYENWAAKTRVFFPSPVLWKGPELPFSFRTVLRREYHGFYLIVLIHFLADAVTDLLGKNEPLQTFLAEDFLWVYFFLISTLIYLAIRILHKYTRLLHVAGR